MSLKQHRGILKFPLIISLFFLLFGGWFLLDLADKQARDTIRKHHLEDIEKSIYFARNMYGTFPPFDQPTWCGTLSGHKDSLAHQQIETALRAQNEKYANPAKPFPTDPDQNNITNGEDYFYWKRSPALFEIYAKLETDNNGTRSTLLCDTDPIPKEYDYGITSIWRENL